MFRASHILHGSGVLRAAGGRGRKIATTVAAISSGTAGGRRSENNNNNNNNNHTIARKTIKTRQAKYLLDRNSTRIIHSSNPRRTRLVDDEEPVVGTQSSHMEDASDVGGDGIGRSSEEVLKLAERMQRRDITGEVPVASFAYEVLKAHPSVRQMGLRERMTFLCDRWERLSKEERQVYLDDPLKGLL